MSDAAALIAETLEVEFCGTAELDPNKNETILRLARIDGAVPGQSAAGERRVSHGEHTSWIGRALSSGELTAAADVTADSRTNDPFFAEHGIRAALIAPLKLGAQSLGAIGAFSTGPREFATDDLLFAEAIAQLVSTTVCQWQAVMALADERRFSQTVLQTTDAFVLKLDAAGRIVQFNRAFEKMTGFGLTELVNRPIWNTLLVFDEVDAVRSFVGPCRRFQAADRTGMLYSDEGR